MLDYTKWSEKKLAEKLLDKTNQDGTKQSCSTKKKVLDPSWVFLSNSFSVNSGSEHFATLLWLRYTILCYTITYYTTMYYASPYHATLHRTTPQFNMLHHTMLHYTIPYYAILYHNLLCYTILYYTILYYTIPYYKAARQKCGYWPHLEYFCRAAFQWTLVQSILLLFFGYATLYYAIL